MAIFLTALAAGGLLCLGLILSFWVPVVGNWFLALVVFAPLAGFFYWQKSARLEQVKLQVANRDGRTVVTVTGHRDELSILEKSLAIQAVASPE
jgi:membrane protein implicated in regulation of membrane protease activity